jgi:DNA-binding SARP family transcriptional activator
MTTAREHAAARAQSLYDQLSPALKALWQQSPVDDINVLKNMLFRQQTQGEQAAINYYNRTVQDFLPGYTPINLSEQREESND